MQLSKKAIKKIDNVQGRIHLAYSLGRSEQWIKKLIVANKVNGPLTTFTALEVIRYETGLVDEQILVDELTGE